MARSEWEKKRDVIRHYDETANSYDSLYGDEQNAKNEHALDAIKMKSTDTILDVGCGTGLLFEHIADSAKLIVGVDVSLGLLKAACKRTKRLPLGATFSLIRADADCLPLRNEVFDKIFAMTVLQNMPEPNLTLQETMRVAKKDSATIITGLKKSFTEERFMGVLSSSGLKPSLIETDEEVLCHIAICRKADC